MRNEENKPPSKHLFEGATVVLCITLALSLILESEKHIQDFEIKVLTKGQEWSIIVKESQMDFDYHSRRGINK